MQTTSWFLGLLTNPLVWWIIGSLVLLGSAIWVGLMVQKQWLGILVDNRGRYSLAQFQMVAWTIVIVPLIVIVLVSSVLMHGAAQEITIPRTLLLVMGIGLGSLAGADAIKGTKDQTRPKSIAASSDDDRPRWLQLFTLEEGALADEAVDIGKFQNFWLTLTLIVVYVIMTASILYGKAFDAISALPDFPDSIVALLLISHAGYLANKLPIREGEPQGLTVALRAAAAQPAAVACNLPPPGSLHTHREIVVHNYPRKPWSAGPTSTGRSSKKISFGRTVLTMKKRFSRAFDTVGELER